MYKYTFLPVPETMTKIAVAEHNLKQADKTLNLEHFIAAATGWLSTQQDKNYQDLEQYLRANNFDTHIFPRETKLPEHARLMMQKNECRYEGVFSCRPKEYALKEILSYWPSYDVSYDNLKYAGMIVTTNTNPDLSTHGFPKQDLIPIKNKNIMDEITKNETLIEVTKISEQTFINNLRDSIIKRFKKTPATQIMGILDDGSPVFTYTIDGHVVTDTAFAIGKDKQITLVELRKENSHSQ